jgi:hypothetical protein
MIVRINIEEGVNMNWSKLGFSWETKLLSLLGVIYSVVVSFNEPTLSTAVHDPKLQLALFGAVLAWFSKSNSAHGTPDNPISETQAAQIAAVAASSAPASVGAAIPGTGGLFLAAPNDVTPVGKTVTVGGVEYQKLTVTTYQQK